MGWDDEYGDGYANGADGSCQTCGEDTDQEWHLLCRRCYAEEQGWTTSGNDQPEAGHAHNSAPSMPAPAFPGDERWRIAYMHGFREGWRAAEVAKADRAA